MEESKMSNESTSWKLVKLLGVASLFASSFYLLQIFLFAIFYFSIDPIVTVDANGIETVRLPNMNWTPFINFAFFSLSSVYFLKFGNLAHKVINASK